METVAPGVDRKLWTLKIRGTVDQARAVMDLVLANEGLISNLRASQSRVTGEVLTAFEGEALLSIAKLAELIRVFAERNLQAVFEPNGWIAFGSLYAAEVRARTRNDRLVGLHIGKALLADRIAALVERRELCVGDGAAWLDVPAGAGWYAEWRARDELLAKVLSEASA